MLHTRLWSGWIVSVQSTRHQRPSFMVCTLLSVCLNEYFNILENTLVAFLAGKLYFSICETIPLGSYKYRETHSVFLHCLFQQLSKTTIFYHKQDCKRQNIKMFCHALVAMSRYCWESKWIVNILFHWYFVWKPFITFQRVNVD